MHRLVGKLVRKSDLWKEEDWIQYIRECGSPNEGYFKNSVGELEVQQVPEEYGRFLFWLKAQGIKSWLEIGIGKGYSFILNFLTASVEKADAVDICLFDTADNIKVKLEQNNTGESIRFFTMTSEEYFKNNNDHYDGIMVDGDHSEEGVRHDFEKAKERLNPGGFIVLHDINSGACPGVVKLWSEIKNERCIEFIDSDTCGIGVWYDNR